MLFQNSGSGRLLQMSLKEKLQEEAKCCGEAGSDDTFVLFHTHHTDRSLSREDVMSW